jgi:hypothetical protein
MQTPTVLPLIDRDVALRRIAQTACEKSTRGPGECFHRGLDLNAEYDVDRVCDPCVAWAALQTPTMPDGIDIPADVHTNPFRLTAFITRHRLGGGPSNGTSVEDDYDRLADAYARNRLFRWYVNRHMTGFTAHQKDVA